MAVPKLEINTQAYFVDPFRRDGGACWIVSRTEDGEGWIYQFDRMSEGADGKLKKTGVMGNAREDYIFAESLDGLRYLYAKTKQVTREDIQNVLKDYYMIRKHLRDEIKRLETENAT